MKTRKRCEPCEDPSNPGNGFAHRTGKRCIEFGCDNPAGTAWSPYWCQPCNAARMQRITDSLCNVKLVAERVAWRELVMRATAHANRYGIEGLHMRCTPSETGQVLSWEVINTPCNCRQGECERKAGRRCRMADEIGTNAQ